MSGLSVSNVVPRDAYGSFVLEGAGFYQHPDGGGMFVAACGVTVNAELIDSVWVESVLPPTGIVSLQVTERLAFSIPAGAGGTSDVRVVRRDGQATVLEGAIVCPSDTATVAVIDVDATEGYVPFTV